MTTRRLEAQTEKCNFREVAVSQAVDDYVCIWKGCREKFVGSMLQGWRWLHMFWALKPEVGPPSLNHVQHMGVLCPDHAPTLNTFLKDIGPIRLATDPPVGKA